METDLNKNYGSEIEKIIFRNVRDLVHPVIDIWDKTGYTKDQMNEKINNLKLFFTKKSKEFILKENREITELKREKEKMRLDCEEILIRLEENKTLEKLRNEINNKKMKLMEEIAFFKDFKLKILEKENNLKKSIKSELSELRKLKILLDKENKQSENLFDLKFVSKSIQNKIKDEKIKTHNEIKDREKELKKLREKAAQIFNEIENEPLELKSMEEFAKISSCVEIKNFMKAKEQFLKIKSHFIKRKEEIVNLKKKIKGIVFELDKIGCDGVKEEKIENGFGISVLEKLKNKYNRLINRLKKEIRTEFIDKIQKIKNLWNILSVSTEKRKAINQFIIKFESENIFFIEIEKTKTFLQNELENLTLLNKKREKLIELIKKRTEIITERHLLNDKDPKRFKIPGRLLKEEKLRKKLKILPKITEKMREIILFIEKGTGNVYLVENKRLLDDLKEFDENERKRIEKERTEMELRRIERKRLGILTPKKRKLPIKAKSLVVERVRNKIKKMWSTPNGKEKRIKSKISNK